MPKLEPLSNGAARGGRRGRGARVSSSLAEINVVPLVDVMLVLLVIFMVATPMMQQGFAVRLPESRRSTAVSAPVTVAVPASFRKDGRVQLGKEMIPLDVLPLRIKQALEGRSQQSVMLASDGVITMDEVFRVMDRLREGGVQNVNIQTQPATRDR
jgi:biopolymer transport protein TolR